jgi:hypothetical protein
LTGETYACESDYDSIMLGVAGDSEYTSGTGTVYLKRNQRLLLEDRIKNRAMRANTEVRQPRRRQCLRLSKALAVFSLKIKRRRGVSSPYEQHD